MFHALFTLGSNVGYYDIPGYFISFCIRRPAYSICGWKHLLHTSKLGNTQMAFTGDPAACEPDSNFEDVQLAGLKLYFGRCLHVWQCHRLKNML